MNKSEGKLNISNVVIGVLLFVFGFICGVLIVDDTFSKKEKFIAWDSEYLHQINKYQKCLFYWSAESKKSWNGKKILCIREDHFNSNKE